MYARSVVIAIAFGLFPGISLAAGCESLAVGSRGSDVSALQTFLVTQYSNFNASYVTGYFGPVTETAVKQWQNEHGIQAIGIVGPQTRAAMNLSCTAATPVSTPAQVAPVSGVPGMCPIIDRALSIGARGSDVTMLQQFFITQNLLSSDSATGFFGQLTQAAVQGWQRSQGVVSSGTPITTGYGVVGRLTLASILRACTTTPVATTTPTTTTCEHAAPSSGCFWQAGTACANDRLICAGGGGGGGASGGSGGSGCIPDSSSPQTQTLACPSGQTGGITQTRISSCVYGASTPVWGSWQTTANTCVVNSNPSDALVQATYTLVLKRLPAAAELAAGGTMLSSSSISELITSLIASPLFASTHIGFGSNDANSVAALYTLLFGRTASPSEISYWNNKSISLSDVIRSMLASAEFLRDHPELVAPTNTCAYGVGTGVDTGPSLAACFNLTRTQALLVPGIYTLKTNIDISKRGTPLQIATKGFETQTTGSTLAPCLATDQDTRCAVLTAANDNDNGPLLTTGTANTITGLNLTYIGFDGNITGRRQYFGNTYWDNTFGLNNSIRNNQANVLLYCTSCSFVGIGSVRAVAASGFIFNGAEGNFYNDVFRENGNGLNRYQNFGQWADGLTVVSGRDVHIQNSQFSDNSDINLIVGGGTNSYIANNTIRANDNFAFGGLMLDGFNISSNYDFTGAIIENNTIDCGVNAYCGIGLDVGSYFWYTVLPSGGATPPVQGATVRNNMVSNTRQGIGIYGAQGTVFAGNSVAGAGGYQLADVQGTKSGITSLVDESLASGQVISWNSVSILPTSGRLIPSLNFSQNPSGTTINQLYYSYKILPSIKTARDFYTWMYSCILGRQPTDSDLVYWTSQSVTSNTLNTTYHTFFSVPEYTNKNTSDQVYVNQLYQCALFRESDIAGNAYLLNLLQNQNRDAALTSILASAEFGNTIGPLLSTALNSH